MASACKAKASSLKEKEKVKKAMLKAKETQKLKALKEKEMERAGAAALKEKEKAELAGLKAKEEALLSPQDLREKRKFEVLVSKDFKEVLKKIVKFDSDEASRLAEEEVAVGVVEEGADEDCPDLNSAVDKALAVFKEVWFAFALERDVGNEDGELRGDRACEVLESVVAKRYDEMKALIQNLIPWMGPAQPNTNETDYPVFEFQGYKAPHHLEKGEVNWRLLGARLDRGIPGYEKLLGAQLACLRRSPRFRALEAFFAMLSIICARKEKCFLEIFETREELESELKQMSKKKPKIKSKKSVDRKNAICAKIEREFLHGAGFFAHSLVKPHATLRVAFAPGQPTLMPAALLITERVALFDAMANPDNGDCSLIGRASSWKWCMEEGTEFAFQEANFGVDHESRDCRQAAEELKADPELRALLLSRKPIVYLDVTASLAPRDVAKKEGLSAIVIAELARLTREAKKRGEAVLFCLGSDSPHVLAEKVYMRKPIGDHGLRCGYFRWRSSAREPWAREANWSDRACHCLQMP